MQEAKMQEYTEPKQLLRELLNELFENQEKIMLYVPMILFTNF